MVAALLVPPPTVLAAPGTIIVDEKHPPKSKQLKPDRNTRVITRKGKHTTLAKGHPEDICGKELIGFFCQSVGRQASERDTGALLGKVVAVAWKSAGQAVSLYLPPPGAEESGPVASGLVKNFIATSGSFYYIIDTSGGVLFIETHRVVIE